MFVLNAGGFPVIIQTQGTEGGVRDERQERDALGNPTDITLPDGQHLSHLYYGSGHLLQTALDGITVSEYERDSLHRQVMRTQGALATFSGYNADNRLSWQRQPDNRQPEPAAG